MSSYCYANLKKRKLGVDNFTGTFVDNTDHLPRKIPTNRQQPRLSACIPTAIFDAQCPQDMVYAILTAEKTLYTKQELLTVIAKLDNLYKPTFSEPCDYIN